MMNPEVLERFAEPVGGLLGPLLGVLGGAVGTYFTVRNTEGPRERAFTIKGAVVCWVLVALFLMGALLMPGRVRFALWVAYAMLLGVGIRWWNMTQCRIRREEASHGGSP
jgi:hypothetical protein